MTDSRNPVVGLVSIIAADYTYRVGSRRVKLKSLFPSVLGSITDLYTHHNRPANDPDNTGLSQILPGCDAPLASSPIANYCGIFWTKMEADYWSYSDIGALVLTMTP